MATERTHLSMNVHGSVCILSGITHIGLLADDRITHANVHPSKTNEHFVQFGQL